MANICLGNLLPSSVLAYDNIDLIPNGFIPEVGVTARHAPASQTGQITEREKIKLLPADRLYAEFWFGVRTRITGTNLGDAGQGAFAALGFLGGGAGAVIGSALACSLTGDAERTISKFVFHVCDSESRLNREIVLTADNIKTKTITLPDYVIAVLGVTKAPIEFVTPTTPLSQAQIDQAKAIPPDEIEQRLGRRVDPDKLTDSDMRVLLNIQELNELENLGNSHRAIRGWAHSADGQIQATFKNFSYSDAGNLFEKIVRDPRKNKYRADNEFDRDKGNCFWNGSTDDLTDKTISFVLSEKTTPPTDGSTPPTPTLLKAGDKVYVSYVAATNPMFRHASENITNFFLFPSQDAYQLPPLDLVKGWNFKKHKFKVRKNEAQRAIIADLDTDAAIQKLINDTQSDSSLNAAQKATRVAELQATFLLEEIESQRLIETKQERANRIPFIKGCYFADSRGICKVELVGVGTAQVIVPRSQIKDQAWFDQLLLDLQADPVGQANGVFDDNGILNVAQANSFFFDDFLFDISDHVNMVCYDNEKYGYERRFAKAIAKCKIFNESDPTSGVGAPNLDFLLNGSLDRDRFDLTSAKFDTVPMQGPAHLFSCNVTFTYDFGFCTKGTINADMILRTPTFFQQLTKKSRIYVERFSPQFPLRPDGGIWVGTKPAFQDNYAVTTNPFNYFGYIVSPDATTGTTNYRVFEDAIVNQELENLSYDATTASHSLPAVDGTLTENKIKYVGFDNILGDQPGYSRGIEITTENALLVMNKIPKTTVKREKLQFTVNEETGRVNVSSSSAKKIRKIDFTYVPNSREFLNEKDRLLSIVFSSTKTVIDNVALPYQGLFSTKERKVSVDTRYVSSEGFFMDGNIMKLITITSVEIEYLDEVDYDKYKFQSSIVSTCFDPSGNWLIFYEDQDGANGDTSKNGFNADGSHLVGPLDSGALPGLQDSTAIEISCLYSQDYGITWFNHKAIVRTVAGETVSSPYAVTDYRSGKVHLFYVLNDTLMHKVINTHLLKYEDAFLGYKRPLALNESTSLGYGLYHFSVAGQRIRESPSSIVIGNLDGDYLTKQLAITKNLIAKQRSDYRFLVSGDLANYSEGFPAIDFAVYKDVAGLLKVMFTANGKLYCRASGNEGTSWFDVIKDGMLIHKNSNVQELKSINTLGITFDHKTNNSYLTYQVDGMLFLRRFEAGNSIGNDKKIREVLGPDSKSSKPMFVIGSLTTEAKTAITNKETPIAFPYDDVDFFGEALSISQVPCLGYVTASGIPRFFYKDAQGTFRAFSYQTVPILDIGYSKV